MELKLENYEEGFGGELHCPSCGFTNLHHEKVDIFERDEDATHCVHVSVEGGKATIDTLLEGNPSSRRHGLTIRFRCEGCKAKPVLKIKQHKGITYFDFN